jgi:uncharacterized membrane protein YraQ (UPF0718 family)
MLRDIILVAIIILGGCAPFQETDNRREDLYTTYYNDNKNKQTKTLFFIDSPNPNPNKNKEESKSSNNQQKKHTRIKKQKLDKQLRRKERNIWKFFRGFFRIFR